MKKKILSLISLFMVACFSVGCGMIQDSGSGSSTGGSTDTPADSSSLSTDTTNPEISDGSDDSTGGTGDSSDNTPDDSDGSSTGGSAGGSDSTDKEPEFSDDNAMDWTDGSTIPDDDPIDPEIPDDKFTDFTEEEKALFTEYVGEVIPFISCDEYSVEPRDGKDSQNYWEGLYYYAVGNSIEEFEAYKALFTAYTLQETKTDKDDDVWYVYAKGDVVVEMAHYYLSGSYYTAVYAYNVKYVSNDPSEYEYTEFTSKEQQMFLTNVGAIIPFLPNSDYFVEVEYDTDYSSHINFSAYDNTPAEFTAYRETFEAEGFRLSSTYESKGKTFYVYKKGTLSVEMCGFYTSSSYFGTFYTVEVIIRDENLSNVTIEKTPDGQDMLTNEGKGLPTVESGVYAVDFTKAIYTKDATEQGLYLDGCPTKGNVKVLVIPVEFSDATAESKGYNIKRIYDVFNEVKDNDDFFSVKEYYAISSAGQLNLEFTVMDSWFRPQYESTYYKEKKLDNGGYMMDLGEQLVIDEALAYYSQTLDLSDFDSDNNGTIDAVICINTMEIKTKPSFQWAFRYWNIYTDEKGNFYTYDGVRANDYMWAAYNFLQHKPYNQYDCDNSYPLNSYTYVHEFGHVLGSEDYYDTGYALAYKDRPLGGKDVMDAIYGDHNPYTKFHYGWLTNSRLIVTEKSVTVTLENFQKTGDTIIIANNWDERLGAYQEYYVLMYYRIEGLNNDHKLYFNEDGIMVYHVNASLVVQPNGRNTLYDVYNNNTTEGTNNGYGTKENLIELVKNANGEQLFTVGDTINANEKDDHGNSLTYNFTVDSIKGDTVTITFYNQKNGKAEKDDTAEFDKIEANPVSKKE